MANNSKANTNSSNVTNLHDGLVLLDTTLKALVDAVNDVITEINDLQPLLNNNVKAKAKPKAKPAKAVKKKVVKKPTPKKSPSEMFLDTINTSSIDEIIEKLKQANARQNVIKNILNERKKDDFQTFTSLEEVVTRIKGLATPSLDKIIQQWS
ncbi:hypothetical protein [Candidatus Marithrix sp. Canyon 246]|uniref:hypothetical protein n=1 Tax=Candidatus Marithrix sp. Canyon 246 TaxID=1827136 RepID=UPI000849FF68|nr:hypothetical protein [Candidatus Marithrix sp. Canyon 246]